MSFILDALRKSEHERQRTAAPGIANVPFGAPRKVLPVWAIALIVVLAVAVLGLGGAYLRSEWSAGARQARVTSPAETPIPPASATRAGPAPERPAPASERPAQLTERSLARDSGRTIPAPSQSSLRGGSATPTSTLAAPAPAERIDEPRVARADRAPEFTGKAGPVLPSAASLEAEWLAVPKLELQLVAFYDSPAERYVFINNARYKEGATLAEGPKVVSITTNGAVMSYLGREFMLTQ
jgi:general secretion pathway protein B